MKKLFTTCYARVKHLPRDAAQVQTSRGAPNWWNPVRKRFEHELAPNDAVFAQAKSKNPGDWRDVYRRQLERLYASGRLKEIVDRTPEGAALLCFEADHCDCHRKVLADFLNEKKLAIVTELDVPLTKAERTVEEEKKQRVLL